MNYEVYGPFPAPRDKTARAQFWEAVEDSPEGCVGLSSAIGVYVFSTRFGDSYTPWYVGKTAAQTGFRGELFAEHKLAHYVSTQKKGERCLHLIAKVTSGESRFCKTSEKSKREIDVLETAMIGMAWRANPKVKNDRKTWFLKNCRVLGLIGEGSLKGRPPESSRTLRNVFATG